MYITLKQNKTIYGKCVNEKGIIFLLFIIEMYHKNKARHFTRLTKIVSLLFCTGTPNSHTYTHTNAPKYKKIEEIHKIFCS